MSSASSTDRSAAGRPRGLALASAGALLSLAAAVAVLLLYRFQPRPGAVFLVLGWLALGGAAVLLVRAASAAFAPAEVLDVEALDASRRTELEREKKLLYKAIKEVEFDRETGKIDDEDADEVIGRYRVRAIEILRALDQDGDAAIEAAIEREVARRLAQGPRSAGDAEGGATALGGTADDAAPGSAADDGAADEAALGDADARTCVRCGVRNDDDAAFCKRCGTGLGGTA